MVLSASVLLLYFVYNFLERKPLLTISLRPGEPRRLGLLFKLVPFRSWNLDAFDHAAVGYAAHP